MIIFNRKMKFIFSLILFAAINTICENPTMIEIKQIRANAGEGQTI